MKFGLVVHGRESEDQRPDAAFDNLTRQVRGADRAGFDFVLVGHHYLITDHYKFQPVPTVARLAGESDRLHFGSTVLLPLHHPVVIAEQYATLDAITGGRAMLCPIAGYRDPEFDALGISKRDRAGRLSEGVRAIKRLWTESNVTFQGEHFSFENATISLPPMQSPRPPIWIGANKDQAVQRAADLGDAWYINPHEDHETISRQLGMIDTPSGDGLHGCQPIRRYAFVAPTDEEAHRIYGSYIEEKFDWYRRADQDEASENPEAFGFDYEQLRDGRILVGSPSTVADGIRTLHKDLGVDCVVLSFNFPGIDYDLVDRAIELTGEEVMPRVRDL